MANDAMTIGPAGGFELISGGGTSFTIPCKGQKIVLPSKNIDVFPGHNEFTADANRLTIAESPWGGMKGTTAPGYTVGTIYTPTSGVYLQDKNGNNTSNTLTAGKLKEVSCLTVNTATKTIEEEFIIKNDSTSNTETPLDITSAAAGWSFSAGAGGAITIDNGLKCTATGVGNAIVVTKTLGTSLAGKTFFVFSIKSSITTTLRLAFSTTGALAWTARNFQLTENVTTTFVLPLTKTLGTTGALPASDSGYTLGAITSFYVGINTPDNTTPYNFTLSNVKTDMGKPAYVEIGVPDDLNVDSSLTLQCWTGAAYETCRVCRLNSAFSDVSSTPANVKFLDTTKLDAVYGSTLGRAVFPKGVRSPLTGSTVTGSTGNITYSANYGSKHRIGLMVMLPPSDSRTAFNQIRMKTILTYANSGASTYEFVNSVSASYGLQNMSNPWLAMLDSSGNVNYLIFTERPNSISFVRDDSGTIYELMVDPGNSLVYRGSTYIGDQTTDTDADKIPNMLEETLVGSISNVLKYHSFN